MVQKKTNPISFIVIIIISIFILSQFNFEGGTLISTPQPIEFEWEGYNWICNGDTGVDNVDRDLSDGSIGGQANSGRCNTGGSVTVGDKLSVSSSTGTYGGCGTTITCTTTNFTADKFDRIVIALSGAVSHSGDGDCNTKVSYFGLNKELFCPNSPSSENLQFQDITLQKSINSEYIIFDSITQTRSTVNQLSFTVSTASASGKTTPNAGISILGIEVIEDLESEKNFLLLTLSEKQAFIDSLNLDIHEQAEFIKSLELTQTDQAELINQLDLTIEDQVVIIQTLSDKIEDQASLINEMTSNLQTKADLVNQLSSENDIQAQLIKEMKESFTNQGIILEALNKSIDDDAIIIGKLTSNLDEQQEIIDSLKQTNQEKEDLINELKISLEEQQEQIEELTKPALNPLLIAVIILVVIIIILSLKKK